MLQGDGCRACRGLVKSLHQESVELKLQPSKEEEEEEEGEPSLYLSRAAVAGVTEAIRRVTGSAL